MSVKQLRHNVCLHWMCRDDMIDTTLPAFIGLGTWSHFTERPFQSEVQSKGRSLKGLESQSNEPFKVACELPSPRLFFISSHT